MDALQVIENTELQEQKAFTTSLMEDFIDKLEAKPKTVETYIRALRQFANFLALNGISQPEWEDVRAFRDELESSGHKPTTIQNYLMAVKQFFKWTELKGLYPNVARGVKAPTIDRENKKRTYLTSRQVKDILESINKDDEKGLRDYTLFFLMASCGLRDIEVNRANIDDLDNAGENTVLYLRGKGRDDKADYVIIPQAVEKALRAYLAARAEAKEDKLGTPLFTSTSNNNRGGRMTTRSISGAIKNRLVENGFDDTRHTAHSLRHTAVTLSLMAGMDIRDVQIFARHKNIATTLIYDHSLKKENNKCSTAVVDAILG